MLRLALTQHQTRLITTGYVSANTGRTAAKTIPDNGYRFIGPSERPDQH